MKSSNPSIEKPLADAVRDAIKQKGMTVQEAATAIQVSHIHLTSLLNGARRISGLSSEKMDLLSSLTGIRKVEMFVLCGLLSPSEVNQIAQPDLLKHRLVQMKNDPELSMYCQHAEDIDSASDRLKLLLAVLYEKAIAGTMRLQQA